MILLGLIEEEFELRIAAQDITRLTSFTKKIPRIGGAMGVAIQNPQSFDVAGTPFRPFRTLPRRVVRRAFRVARNLIMDLRYGGYTGGVEDSLYSNLGVGRTESSEFSELEFLFEKGWFHIKETDVLVDVGCGRGRVLNYWLSLGLRNRLIGIEFNEEIADRTRRRLRKYPNVIIVTGDVLENIPPDGTVYFAYNPAAAPIMARFKEALWERSQEHEDLVFIYYVSHHLSIFADDERWKVRRIRMPSGVDAAIIRPRDTELGT
jgi:hypothetical protein